MSIINIKTPELCTITISGGTQTGKSIMLDAISKLIESNFNGIVVCPQLDKELRMNDYSSLAKWQKDMVANTVWYLKETGKEGDV
jgi:Flp pilus assembly CpaF family ATPase